MSLLRSKEQPRESTPAPEHWNERLHTLPNQMEIAYQSRVEVDFFYQDIFEHEVYLQHGITIADGDCIFDVGANIGFFTMFVHHKCRPAAVYAFEPAPPLFKILSRNASLYGEQTKLFNYGLSNESKCATFTFYPNSSGMSSFYGDEREEKEALRAIMVNQWRKGMAQMEQVLEHADDLLEERFRSESFDCQLRTLSEVISEHQVRRIDLLKIDVQKSELDVLLGIGDDDWEKIQQIVMEVHDIEGRLEVVTQLLARHDFNVTVAQDDMYEGSVLYNLYASRRSTLLAFDDESSLVHIEQPAFEQIHSRAKKQGDALYRQRQLMRQRRKD